jgi:hypothetical protein
MGQDIMEINDYRAKRLAEQDIFRLFELSKVALLEKGIDNIEDNILMSHLKNNLVRKHQAFDFGLFKLNTMVGYIFVDVSQYAYEDRGFAIVDQIYLLPEFRTEANYVKLLKVMVDTLTPLGVKDIKTTDNFTLCNDCEIFAGTIKHLGEPRKMYRIMT